MPTDAPTGCFQSGSGIGDLVPLRGASNVVAVVGSAHVGGLVRMWESASDLTHLSELLKAQELAGERSDDYACLSMSQLCLRRKL